MAEAKAQKARRVLVAVVSSYDSNVVRKAAIENSAEFLDFLSKEVHVGDLDTIDHVDIMMEIEEALGIELPDEIHPNWKSFFDRIVVLLNEQ